jgi:hypothetical protein
VSDCADQCQRQRGHDKIGSAAEAAQLMAPSISKGERACVTVKTRLTSCRSLKVIRDLYPTPGMAWASKPRFFSHH